MRNAPSIVEGIFGSWELAWTAVVQSGNFFTPSFSGFDPSNTNTVGGRPDRIGDGNRSSGRSIDHWFDAAAFKIPGCPDTDPVCRNPENVGRFGNSGLNILRAPAIKNLNLALMKSFPIRERARLQFRLLMNNALNHPMFSIPRANISSPGTVATISSSTRVSSGASPDRQVHLVVRLDF
jgi:hypothetical protein